MAAALSYFEVQLSEDVLLDIKTEGKAFKADLIDIQQSCEDPAGADYTKTALSAAADNRHKSPVPRIQLEKINDRLIRLFVTVYKSSVEVTDAQSETVAFGSDQTSTQTDSSEWMQSGSTQANSSEWSHVIGIQTDQSEWLRSEATQTDVGTHFVSTQTDWKQWLHSANVQTDCSHWQSTVTTQTEVKQLSSSAAQTKEMRITQMFSDVAVETQANLATQVSEQVQAVAAMSNAHSQMSVDTADCHCQVTPLVTDGAVQTERHSMQSEAQTELSIAWRAERETQVVTAVSESSVQASVSVNITECQTDSSMANLLSEEVQACTDVICSDSQTDLSQLDSEAQTEMSMSQQVNSEVQAVVTLTDSQTEHVAADIDASLVATQSSAINESFDDYAGNTTLPHGTSLQHLGDQQDSSSQTDPVTIIIGDASFLVKKLKNSAGSPSRVTTTGNEIEIELSADAVTEGSAADYQLPMPLIDDKQNEMMRQQAAMIQQQPAVVRSGGVMCRGAGVSGPRFRMPVSQSPPARMPSGLLVRHPTQQVVIAPQLQQQAVPGPQPVVGGSFSCPFCSLTFIDSPALYEHLSILHTVDQKTKWKQPRGREGKTIVPVKRSGKSPGMTSPSELSPPVLAAVEVLNRSGEGNGLVHGDTAQQSHTDGSNPQETGLFEDPVEPEATKKQRGRPPKHSIEEGATAVKRQKVMADDDDDSALVSPSKQQASSDKQSTPSGGKRGGRTPRSRRKS